MRIALSRALLAALALCVASSSAQAQGAVPTVRTPKVIITGPDSTGPVDGMLVLGRSLATRAQDEINALDNGVVCNGVTDNAAALATIRSKLTSGKTVFFPPAAQPCLTSAPLTITTSNVTVRAVPGTVVLKPTAGNTSAPVLLNIANASNVLIDGLGIDGGGQNFGTVNNVVQVFNGDNVVIDRASFANTRGIAVLASQSKFSGVRRSSFRNAGNRWKTTSVATDRQQAIAFCCTAAGKTPADYPGNFATDNAFVDIGLDSISFGDGANVVATGNRCQMENNQVALLPTAEYAACVYTTNIVGATIGNNYVSGATGNAIDIHNATGFTVTGNYINGSGSAGIGVFGSYGSVSGNTVLNSVKWSASPFKGGISVSGVGLVGVSVTGNLIADTQATPTQPFGVEGSTGSCTNCLFDNNRINGFATAAYGGYLTGPTVRPVSAGGTGLTGGAWATWTPTFTAEGGAGVTFNLQAAAYEQVGKTLRGRIQFQVSDTGTRPTAINFTLPGGQQLKGNVVGSAFNFSNSASLQLSSNGLGLLRLRSLTSGGPFIGSSGEFIAASFEVEVQ